ncbi:MAG TPA: ABC transporter substrate-binding protein, partial [Methylomirabilota bacterium]
MRRRDFLKISVAGAAGTSLLAAPRYLRAQGPIKIGMPAALSGSYAQYGIQAKRAADLFSKDIKAKGILGRPVEFIFEDTAGD